MNSKSFLAIVTSSESGRVIGWERLVISIPDEVVDVPEESRDERWLLEKPAGGGPKAAESQINGLLNNGGRHSPSLSSSIGGGIEEAVGCEQDSERRPRFREAHRGPSQSHALS